MKVWSYWSGPKPEWIATCIETIRSCCVHSEFHLVTPENAGEYVPESLLNERWRTITPGVATDCIRAALLAKHGGLWMDADTICLRDPVMLMAWHHHGQALYSTWPSKPDRCIAGYFYSPAKHPVVMEWLASINAALQYSENIGWMDIGEKMLTPIIRRSPSSMLTWQIGRETFLPLNVADEPERLFAETGWRDFVTPYTIAFGLNNSWMMHNRAELMNKSAAEMRESGVMVHRLLADARNAIEAGKNPLD